MSSLSFIAFAAIATGTSGVGIYPHVQIESSVAAEFGSDYHRIHRSESAKTACFKADGEIEEKKCCDSRFRPAGFPRET